MYSMATIIYGVPLTEEIDELIEDWEANWDDADGECPWNEDDDKLCGFTTMYSGGSNHTPGYCGVELDTFDEAEGSLDGYLGEDKLVIQVSAKQKKKALALIDKLHPYIKKLLPKVGIYRIWHTS